MLRSAPEASPTKPRGSKIAAFSLVVCAVGTVAVAAMILFALVHRAVFTSVSVHPDRGRAHVETTRVRPSAKPKPSAPVARVRRGIDPPRANASKSGEIIRTSPF